MQKSHADFYKTFKIESILLPTHIMSQNRFANVNNILIESNYCGYDN